MRTVTIREAKAQLSRLVEQAVRGESLVITDAGRPMVKVTAVDRPSQGQVRRLGFMVGQIAVPDDFDRMGTAKVDRLFCGIRG